MKLVEILARELKEWPETTLFYAQNRNGTAYPYAGSKPIYKAREWVADTSSGSYVDMNICDRVLLLEIATDHATAIVTREMWEEERAKMESRAEWNGEGLPPVGAVCEAWHNGSAQGVVEVRYAGDCMVLWNVERRHEQCSDAKDYSFRPIRTQKQIAAQERERALDEIYRIIRTVERPGNKADMAEALYAAGYRKQEQSE